MHQRPALLMSSPIPGAAPMGAEQDGDTQHHDWAQALLAQIPDQSPIATRGRVSKAVGVTIEATGIQAHVGELCELCTPGEPPLLAEVVGFQNHTALLTPLGPLSGISSLTEVIPTGRGHSCPVGQGLLGRVINALGEPIDKLGPLNCTERSPVQRAPLGALDRRKIDHPLITGVRVIDGFLTLGEGQRIGIFAPPGVGKSTLTGMLARESSADINVVALIGERGREVQEFLEDSLGAEGLKRSVVVVSTSDRPPMERIQCAYVATAIAEHFRDHGKRVLLMMDSLTRFARAQREVGLASGEPPTRRSYPPSVFSMLPRLLERAGQGQTGSITATYTVLTEGDEESDPIAEEVRSILDGHIVLSRPLAAANHYPAIDVLASISRVASRITTPEHQAAMGRCRAWLAQYKQLEMLIQIGEYRPGQDADADAAVRVHPHLQRFLRQSTSEATPFMQTLERMLGMGV
jgi:ATP synthase in type III secretion protein N